MIHCEFIRHFFYIYFFRLYQIGAKFRGEMKPKFGLIRANEFIMKDLYTFDKDKESATQTYHKVSLHNEGVIDECRNTLITIFRC